MKFFTHYSTALLSLIFFLAACMVPVTVYMQTESLNQYVQEAQDKAGEDEFLQESDREIKRELLETKPSRDALAAFSVRRGAEADLISRIEGEAEAAGVDLSIGGVSVVEREGVFNFLSINMQAEGAFGALLSLLWRLETMPLGVSARSVVLERSVEGGWSVTLTIEALMQK